MKSKANRSKRIDITQDYEPMSRVKSKLARNEKLRAERTGADLSKPEIKMGRATKKNELKGHERKSWLSSSEWKNYGHFF